MEKNEENQETHTAQKSAGDELEYSDLLCKLVCLVKEDYFILQVAEYIEDGWYIKVIPSQVQLWEIPQYGGVANIVCSFSDVSSAVKYATAHLA